MSVLRKRQELERRVGMVHTARFYRWVGIVGVPSFITGAVWSFLRVDDFPPHAAIVWSVFFAYEAILWTVLAVRSRSLAQMDPFQPSPDFPSPLPQSGTVAWLTFGPLWLLSEPFRFSSLLHFLG